MRGFHWAFFVGLLVLVVAFCACGKKEFPPELMEAKSAVAESKAEGAAEKCPDEYKSAELMLSKAEAFYAGGDEKGMQETAKSTIKLADDAKDCAAKKAAIAPPSGPQVGELPKEMAEYKVSAYFNFNDNSISSAEAEKLKSAAGFIQQNASKLKFWVILTASADRPGDPKDNFELSKRRGIVVRHFLAEQGVDPDIMLIKPMGEALITGTDKKAVKDAQMRRVDITFVPYHALESIKIGSPYIYEKSMLPEEKPKK
jgi:outer membrane protein OmpA-like peptidoglycan-associated protein